MRNFIFAMAVSLLAFGDIHVRDFGAKGDGRTDDTQAVVAAFDRLKSEGGVLKFAPGKYVFKGLLKVAGLSNSVVDFSGATLLNAEQKGSFHFDKCEGLTIRGGILTYMEMPFKGNFSEEHPIYVTDSKNVRIEGVHVLGSVFMGIAVNHCNYVWVVNCRLERILRDGIHFVHSQDITCTGNHVFQASDDAIALIDYGHGKAQRTIRAIVANNIIRETYAGMSCVGAQDVIFQGNHLERTILSGCQVTTNDRFARPADGAGCTRVARVKVIGNRFVENCRDLELNGVKIKANGQASTGAAAIVVAYIDFKEGWVRDGDKFFTRMGYKFTRTEQGELMADASLSEELFPGRVLSIGGKSASVTSAKVTAKGIQFGIDQEIPEGVETFELGRILTDVDIVDNEVIRSYACGLAMYGTYRARIINNRFFNCNSYDTQWTQTILGVMGGQDVEILGNWIHDNRDPNLHRHPLHVSARNARVEGNRVE